MIGMDLSMLDFHIGCTGARIGLLVSVVLSTLMIGCGGGGGGGSSACPAGFLTCNDSSGGGTTTTPTTATQLSLVVDTPSIQTDGSAVVTVSATLKDSKNAVVPGVMVNFSADSGTLSAASATTNADGVAAITFNSNDNKTNRTVGLTAQSGMLSSKASIAVQGTSVHFGGDTSAVIGKSASLSVALLDGANKAVAFQDVKLVSRLGNPVPAQITTDVDGKATIVFSPSIAGADAITATALGAVLTQEVVISSIDFSFSFPAVGATVTVEECSPVRVRLTGATVSSARFTVSRGIVYPTSACAVGGAVQSVSFSGGVATAYVKSSSAGAGTVYADISEGGSVARTSLPIKFLATVPNNVVIQSDPSVVFVNGSAAITALVRDAAGNPVSGREVNFSAPSGGGVPDPTSAFTNDAGVASSTFKADSTISGKDSVQIKASVVGALVEATTKLTVGGKAVNIVIGTDNEIVLLENPPRFRKIWGVVVSDPASGPIKNQVVTISLRGTQFDKGWYSLQEDAEGTKKWVSQIVGVCPAEDANNNGVVEDGEVGDQDQDGFLEPNGAAIVRSSSNTGGVTATVTTDESGAAAFWVEYLRNYGSWAKVELKATANVAGTNSSAVRSFYLPVPSSELTSPLTPPSFVVSPFGENVGCNSH